MKNRANIVRMTVCFLLALITPLLLGGCGSANYVWYQPEKDLTTFKQDHLQCEEQSAKYARYMDKRGNKDIIFERMKECMGVRGYVRTEESELPEGVKGFK